MKNKILKHYPLGGMLIVTMLTTIGFALLYFLGLFNIKSFSDFYNIIYNQGMVVIFSSFFIFVGLYCYISFFINVIIKPKKDILLLKDINGNFYTFVNKSGKKFEYFDENLVQIMNMEENKFYEVLRSYDYIVEVNHVSNHTFNIPKTKRSYWFNYYSPYGNFENIFLLPIIYVILLPGLLSFLISKGFEKIFGLLFMGYPAYLIIYDLLYKIRNK